MRTRRTSMLDTAGRLGAVVAALAAAASGCRFNLNRTWPDGKAHDGDVADHRLLQWPDAASVDSRCGLCVGCCKSGTCVPLASQSAVACGANGASCVTCAGGTCKVAACNNGICATKTAPASTPCTNGSCDVNGTCCTGCVANGVCSPGTSSMQCGTGGKPCQACPGGICLAGVCS